MQITYKSRSIKFCCISFTFSYNQDNISYLNEMKETISIVYVIAFHAFGSKSYYNF